MDLKIGTSEKKQGVPDRASRRLFSSAILKPSGKQFTGDVSQKILSATACRYFIFWMCNLLNGLEENPVDDGPCMSLDNLFHEVLSPNPPKI